MTAAAPVWFRCAGSATVGLGHVVRSIALAEAARARGCASIRFAMDADPVATNLPREAGFDVETVVPGRTGADEAAWMMERLGTGAWVVMDGYALGDRIAPLRARGARVCAIDDSPGGVLAREGAEVWVNPRIDGRVQTAPRQIGAALVGPRYAPVRASFRAERLTAAEHARGGAVRVILLSGGSDIAGLTPRALAALRGAVGADLSLDVVVVLGPSAPALGREVLEARRDHFQLSMVRAPRDLAALMANADLAITAAGTSVFELLCLGVPPLLVTVVDNQAGVAAAIERAGAGIDLGTPATLDAPTLGEALRRAYAAREALATAGRRLVDGGGARRVIATLFGRGLVAS